MSLAYGISTNTKRELVYLLVLLCSPDINMTVENVRSKKKKKFLLLYGLPVLARNGPLA